MTDGARAGSARQSTLKACVLPLGVAHGHFADVFELMFKINFNQFIIKDCSVSLPKS